MEISQFRYKLKLLKIVALYRQYNFVFLTTLIGSHLQKWDLFSQKAIAFSCLVCNG